MVGKGAEKQENGWDVRQSTALCDLINTGLGTARGKCWKGRPAPWSQEEPWVLSYRCLGARGGYKQEVAWSHVEGTCCLMHHALRPALQEPSTGHATTTGPMITRAPQEDSSYKVKQRAQTKSEKAKHSLTWTRIFQLQEDDCLLWPPWSQPVPLIHFSQLGSDISKKVFWEENSEDTFRTSKVAPGTAASPCHPHQMWASPTRDWLSIETVLSHWLPSQTRGLCSNTVTQLFPLISCLFE